MGKLPSYKELQQKIIRLETELSELQSDNTDNPYKISHKHFFEICEYSKNAISIFETTDNAKTFTIKYFNKKAEDAEGVCRDKIIGEKLIKVFPSVLKSGFLETLQRVYKSNTPEEFPAVVFSSNKIIEWKHNHIYKLSDNELVSIYVDEADKRNKEQELIEHREKLHIAMEAASYFSFEVDVPAFKIKTNKEVYLNLGYAHSDIDKFMAKSFSLIHPEDFKKAKLLVTQHSKNLIPSLNTEFRIKDVNDNWVWFMAAGKIIEWDKNSKPLRFFGLIKNIQEEKEIHLKLEESEEKFKSLATLLPEVIYETDIQGNLTFVNSKALEIFEYSQSDFDNGLNIMQMLAPEEIPRAQKNFEKVFKSKNVSGLEYTALSKYGKRFPILVYINAIVESDNFKGTRGIIVNISDLKKAQQQHRSSKENFLQLSENINDAFWLRSLDHKIIFANPACVKIVGKDFMKVFQDFNHYKNWIHPDDKEEIVKLREDNLKHPEKNHFYEHRIINPEGETKWVWIRTFPVYNDKGELYRRAGIASDITEHKKLLSDLITSKEKAEESDRLKSAFLANMSHEIRTPMNGILGFAELLKDSDTTNKEKEDYLKIINVNGNQLLNLIDDIVDIAKIEAGQLALNNTNFEINSVLNEVYLLCSKQQKWPKKENVTFELDVPQNKHNMIFTDVVRLRQILTNLISNAFKFTELGSITFGYELINNNDSSGYYKFFVSDTGVGISDTKKEYIFERFRQDKSPKYLNQQGTGIGLAISKGLIELLGGKVWVESTLENASANIKGGSTFYFTIPYKIKNSDTNVNNNVLKSKTMEKWDNPDILVVEDDEDNLEFLRRLLVKFGASVVLARTGEEAVEIIKSNEKIKVVLMDIRLPDMDGFETTKKIKLLKPTLPVIAQTAYAMYNDREKCLENGCDDYVSKPLDRDILFKKINHYIYN